MSSSHRKDRPYKIIERSNLGKEPLPCPECGKICMVHVIGDCELLDGTIVPNLRRLQCSSCNEDFFDHDAMGVIQSYRREISNRNAKGKKEREVEIA